MSAVQFGGGFKSANLRFHLHTPAYSQSITLSLLHIIHLSALLRLSFLKILMFTLFLLYDYGIYISIFPNRGMTAWAVTCFLF